MLPCYSDLKVSYLSLLWSHSFTYSRASKTNFLAHVWAQTHDITFVISIAFVHAENQSKPLSILSFSVQFLLPSGEHYTDYTHQGTKHPLCVSTSQWGHLLWGVWRMLAIISKALLARGFESIHSASISHLTNNTIYHSLTLSSILHMKST